MKFKQLLIGFILGAVLFSTISIFATNYIVNPNPFPILVNGENKEVEALNINNSTYLKLADTGKALNTKVTFNSDKKQIEIDNSSEVAPEPNSNEWIRTKDYSMKPNASNDILNQINNYKQPGIYTLYHNGKIIKMQIYGIKSYFNIADLKAAGIYTE